MTPGTFLSVWGSTAVAVVRQLGVLQCCQFSLVLTLFNYLLCTVSVCWFLCCAFVPPELPENWTDTKETLLEGMVFNVKYLGMTLVGQPKGEDMASAAIRRIVAMVSNSYNGSDMSKRCLKLAYLWLTDGGLFASWRDMSNPGGESSLVSTSYMDELPQCTLAPYSNASSL